MIANRRPQTVRTAPPPVHLASRAGTARLLRIYREAIEEYLLALAFQGRRQHSGRWFHWSVLGGQVGLLVLIAATMSIGTLFSKVPVERPVIERWIQEHDGDFAIVQWYPAVPHPKQSGTIIVRAQYRYFRTRNKPVETNRLFTLRENRVVRVDSSL